ncbi:unnamed protein product [Orchesella dallaii]|uniref:Ion transport domain-containing protein n=1 Tax=Orchesella dallaii TaxID=48710 RepID=A0ABP1QMG1_9HEXA
MAALNGNTMTEDKLSHLPNETVLLLSQTTEPREAERRRALDDDDLIKFQQLKLLIYQGDSEQLFLKLVADDNYQNFWIDTQDDTDRCFSLLHHAALKREVDCLRALLELEASPNIQAENGQSAIHLLVSSDCRCEACIGAILDCLQILCDGGAEVDLEDAFGETSLYYAARNRLEKPAELLLSNGANINHWVDGTSVATVLARYTPDVLNREFDKCVLIEDNGSPRGLRLDFRLLLQDVAIHEGFARELSSPRKGIFPADWTQRSRSRKGVKRIRSDVASKKDGSKRTLSSSTSSLPSSTSVVPPKETELLNYLLKAELPAIEAVVNHPLVEAFLHLKWLSVRKLFFVLRSLYLLLMSLYTFYVFDTFVHATCFYPNRNQVAFGESSNSNMAVIMSLRENNDNDTTTTSFNTKEKVTFGFFNPTGGPQPWQSFSDYFKANEMTCEPSLRTMIIAYLFAGYAITGVLYELYKMCESWGDYFRTPLNLAWWILAGNMAITSLPGMGLYGHSWLYPYAALSLVYGWILVLAQVGRIPYFGIFVGIFVEVLKDFCLLLFTFSPILLAFALGFSVMLPQNEFFRSIPTALFKVFLMMTGDVDFWGIFRETWAVVSITEKKGFVYIPLFFIYTSFILMVTMVLMSLLLGLAVNDIQEIRREASLKRTVRLIQEIGIFESMLQIPMFFHCGCSQYIMRLFSITSLACMNGPELITFPDDPYDLSLPSEIKQKLVPYLKRGCCSDYARGGKKAILKGGSGGSSPFRMKNNKGRTSRLGSSEKVIIKEEENVVAVGENKSERFLRLRRQLSENGDGGDPDVEKSKQVLYRDLSMYHEVKMLLNSNEEMRGRLEALKIKLISKN